MLSRIKAVSRRLKEVVARHFFLCCALVVSGVVVIAVPQVRYAFWVEELFSDSLGAVLRVALLAVFLLYNVLSLILLRPPARWRNRLDWPLRTVEASLHWPVALAKRRAEGRRRMLVPCLTALGCLGLAAYFVTPGVLHWYALSDLLAVNVGWLSLLLAAWLILAPSHLKKDDPATHMTVVEVQGRFVGWLVVSYAIEEALWAASSVGLLGSLDWAVGYVLFSGWAFLQAIFLVLMAAHLVDYWDNSSPWPIRMFAAAAFAVLLLLNLTSVPVRELATGEPASANGSGGDAEDRWLEILERRIDAVPVGPAVLVAASGGGSRAAVFSGLAYEAIARLPSFDDHRLAEHVVMISSVSGGSLATTHFISRNARQSAAVERICHTSRRDLIQRSLRFLDNEKAALAERQASPKVRPEDRKVIAARIAAIQNAQGWLREGRPKGPPAPKWLLEHQFFDDMATDFMAPILRGGGAGDSAG